MCKKAMSSGAGADSGRKILGAGAAPKQAGSQTLGELRMKGAGKGKRRRGGRLLFKKERVLGGGIYETEAKALRNIN